MKDDATIELIDSFKNKFNLCESVYKVILKKHQNVKGNKKVYLKLTMTQIPFAMKFAGYNVDRDLLNRLFGSETKKGRQSIKKLRDSVTHSIKQSAVDEIKARERELFNDMDSFLEIIRNCGR